MGGGEVQNICIVRNRMGERYKMAGLERLMLTRSTLYLPSFFFFLLMNQREIQKYEVVKDDSNDGADFACTQPSYAIACRAAVIVYAVYNRALD